MLQRGGGVGHVTSCEWKFECLARERNCRTKRNSHKHAYEYEDDWFLLRLSRLNIKQASWCDTREQWEEQTWNYSSWDFLWFKNYIPFTRLTRRPAGSQIIQFLHQHDIAGISVLPLEWLTAINERVSIVPKLNTVKTSLFKLHADLLLTLSLMINASSISY